MELSHGGGGGGGGVVAAVAVVVAVVVVVCVYHSLSVHLLGTLWILFESLLHSRGIHASNILRHTSDSCECSAFRSR